MHNKHFDHSPACQESPRYCICTVQNRQNWPSPEVTLVAEHPAPLTAGLRMKHPGNVTEISVADPPGNEAWAKRLRTQRDEAVSAARFWRGCAIYLGISAIAANVATVGSWSGWW